MSILGDGDERAHNALRREDTCRSGWARAAAYAGYRTYFTTAARCHRAALEGRWATTMRFYAGPTLLVIDLCRHRHRSTNSATYHYPARQASALFQVVSQRSLSLVSSGFWEVTDRDPVATDGAFIEKSSPPATSSRR